MLMFEKKRSSPVGARPGTLTESDDADATVASAIRYDADQLDEREVTDFSDLSAPTDRKLWLRVQGLRDLRALSTIRDDFGIHKLAIEDVINIPQRPKADTFSVDGEDDHVLWITRMAFLEPDGTLETEQVSVVFGRTYVVTFEETHSEHLAPVRERLAEAGRPIRRNGPDYLAYAIVDVVVDGYYPVLELIAERLEAMEERIMTHPTPRVLQRLQRWKRALLLLRRAVWPQREALARLLREPTPLIAEDTKVYLRDTYDHLVQIADVIESYRDLVSELTNTYLSVVSNRMNEIMKVLTIMASIFIPLTFMAGIYGMNFESMPELSVRWAYPALLASMAVVVVAMLWFFRRKGWLGGGPDDDDL